MKYFRGNVIITFTGTDSSSFEAVTGLVLHQDTLSRFRDVEGHKRTLKCCQMGLSITQLLVLKLHKLFC